MRRRLRLRVLALAAVTALLAAGCPVEDGTRCAEIDHILTARGEQLPRDCTADDQCLLVEVRPGIAAVSNREYEPSAEVRNLRAEYEASCGEFAPRYRAAVTSCQAFGQLGQCVVSAESNQRDRDAGEDGEAGADVLCECVSDAQCPAAAPVCNGCLCRDDCGLACDAARTCGAIDELGLGLDVTDCIVRCQDLEESDVARARAITDCLREEPCGAQGRCVL
jgi:hypothetical protein